MRTCLVTTDLMAVSENSAAGFALGSLAKQLSHESDLDILLVQNPLAAKSPEFKIWQREYRKQNIGLKHLEFPRFEIETPFLFFAHSYLTYLNLKNSNYDVIFFLDRGGIGYHCGQAKNLKLAFGSTNLVTVYTGSLVADQTTALASNRYSELVQDYVEKKALLASDCVLFPTEHARKSVSTSFGNKFPMSEVFLFSCDLNDFDRRTLQKNRTRVEEICFVGHLEKNPHLTNFLNAVLDLKTGGFLENTRVSLMCDRGAGLSAKSKKYLSLWCEAAGLQIEVQSDLHFQARAKHLESRKALAVISPSADATGAGAVHCVRNGIPFLHSDEAGLNEIFQLLAPSSDSKFKSDDPIDLSRKIRDQLRKQGGSKKRLAVKASARPKLGKVLSQMIPNWQARHLVKPEKITVCIVFFDRPEFLQQNLLSLKPLGPLVSEILIYVNRASLKKSKAFLLSLRTDRRVRFVKGPEELAPGHARNKMALAAKTENLLFLDDDNLVDSEALKRLLQCGVNDWDVLCSPLKRFDTEHLQMQEGSSAQQIQFRLENITFAHWLPVGDDIALNVLENKIGDCNFLAKRTHLLKVGGFNESLFYGEDQEFLVRSVYKGARYFLSPESFVFYRTHGSNLTKDVDHDQESFKLMQVILSGLNLTQLLPAFDLLRSSGFEVEKKAQFETVRDIYNQSNFLGASDRDFATFAKFAKDAFKNKLVADNESASLELETLAKTGAPEAMKKPANRAVEVVFFAAADIDISIFDSEVSLTKGYTIATIRFHDREKISVYSSKKTSIYILKIKEALI